MPDVAFKKDMTPKTSSTLSQEGWIFTCIFTAVQNDRRHSPHHHGGAYATSRRRSQRRHHGDSSERPSKPLSITPPCRRRPTILRPRMSAMSIGRPQIAEAESGRNSHWVLLGRAPCHCCQAVGSFFTFELVLVFTYQNRVFVTL
jgi:hypothetical protein